MTEWFAGLRKAWGASESETTGGETRQSVDKKKEKGGGRLFPPKKEQLVVLLLIGLLLMVIVWPSGSDTGQNTAQSDSKDEQASLFGTGTYVQKDASQSSDNSTQTKEDGGQTQTGVNAAEDYAAYLEERLAECLSVMEGVGKVQVFVTMKNGGEAVLAKDKSSSLSSDGGEEAGSQDSQTSEETVYADGENGQTPYVIKELTPLVRGVLVVAEGGGDPLVQQNISEAAEALFSIESHKIKVVRMKEG